MNSTFFGLLGIFVLLILLFIRMPVGFSLAAVGFAGFSLAVSMHAGMNVLFKEIFSTFSEYSFTSAPLFILMGSLAYHTGMTGKAYHTAHKWLGHLPGGLAMATIVGCAGFAAICGSSIAMAGAMGSIALPEMLKYKYDKGLATGSIAAGGSLGLLIPPSITFIIYGIITEQSIGQLFIAGIFPGILLAVMFTLSVYVRTIFNPALGPRGGRVSFKERFASIGGIADTSITFLLLMGGLVLGWFTPTEAGAVGVAAVIIITLARGAFTWEALHASLIETVRMTAMLFVIVAGAMIFSRFLAITRIPSNLAEMVSALSLSPHLILFLIILVYICGGCIMESVSFILLTIPIFYPLILSLGFDPIWFGVIIVLVNEIGVITPPVGMNVFVLAGVAKDVPMQTIFKGILPFMAIEVLCILILIAFPQIALYLPGRFH